MLPWKGSYLYAAECLLGDLGLQKSFTIMYNHLEGSQLYELAEVQQAGETFIIHLPEASRSNVLYHKIDNDFIDGHSKLGSVLLSDARNWRDRTKKAFLRMVDSSPDKWALKKQTKSIGHQPESVEEKVFGIGSEEVLLIIEDIRVYYRKDKKSRIFRLQDLPVQLGSQGPVNNKLSDLLKFGAQDLPDYMFLVEPFLKFKRAQNTNQTSTDSKASKNMDGPSLDSQGCNSVPKANVTKLEEKLRVSLGLKSHSDECEISAKVVSQQQQEAEQNHACVGIKNLGNTCFANSTLQLLHCVPELMPGLIRFSTGTGNPMADQASRNLTEAIYQVFLHLDHSPDVVCPEKFLKNLEERHPMYKERVGRLHQQHQQQDAGECLLHLIETLTETLKTGESESDNLVKRLFGVDLSSSVSNGDGEEFETVPVDHLDCSMPDDVDGLLNGLERALQVRNSSINRLPRYLPIILERVKFDSQIGQSVKNFNKLDYPLEFDAYSLCSKELKYVLAANRKATSTNGEDSLNMDIDKDLSTEKDQLTGLYDLVALIAHEGPNVNSGHYIALVKQDEDQWIQFDDESKTILNNEGVLKLTGGGDGQMAYVCLYKARAVREGALRRLYHGCLHCVF